MLLFLVGMIAGWALLAVLVGGYLMLVEKAESPLSGDEWECPDGEPLNPKN